MERSQTQILATLGPASESVEVVRKLVEAGANAFRLNFSWGDHDGHQKFIDNVRTVTKEKGMAIPIIGDLSGPRIQEGEGHTYDDSKESVITEKDKKDLKFCVENGIEYVAMSFVGTAQDIVELRGLINDLKSNIKIIAKVERKKALDHVDQILEEADAMMVARGDLGEELPVEKIPFTQYTLIQKASYVRKPVIVATDMMPSMIKNPKPSRSDVSDVANAVSQGADVVMLSGETAVGDYPVETVGMMDKIVLQAEKHAKRGFNSL